MSNTMACEGASLPASDHKVGKGVRKGGFLRIDHKTVFWPYCLMLMSLQLNGRTKKMLKTTAHLSFRIPHRDYPMAWCSWVFIRHYSSKFVEEIWGSDDCKRTSTSQSRARQTEGKRTKAI